MESDFTYLADATNHLPYNYYDAVSLSLELMIIILITLLNISMSWQRNISQPMTMESLAFVFPLFVCLVDVTHFKMLAFVDIYTLYVVLFSRALVFLYVLV